MESLQQFGQPFNCTIGKRLTCFRSSFLSFGFCKENTTAERFMTDHRCNGAKHRVVSDYFHGRYRQVVLTSANECNAPYPCVSIHRNVWGFDML
jgi:hypothetical protein